MSTARSTQIATDEKPFADDLEYLLAELDWVHIRVERIALQRELEEQSGRGGSYHLHGRFEGKCPERLERLLSEEEAHREGIDSRVTINRTEGPALGLDRVCDEHALGEFERTMLLLAVVPVLGRRIWERKGPSDPVIDLSVISAETVSLFLESPDREHLRNLRYLLPTAPLRFNGLIEMGYDPCNPSNACSVDFVLTGKGLAELSGVAGFTGFN